MPVEKTLGTITVVVLRSFCIVEPRFGSWVLENAFNFDSVFESGFERHKLPTTSLNCVGESGGRLSTIDLSEPHHFFCPRVEFCSRLLPARDCYRVTDQSRRSKLHDALLDRSRWLEPLQENILHAGQHFCRYASGELLQGRHYTSRKFLG